MFTQKFANNIRSVSGPSIVVYEDDYVLNVNTTTLAAVITLDAIVANYWSTQYKLLIVDASGSAASNNITINCPAGFFINGASSLVINTNKGIAWITIANNTNYTGFLSSWGSGSSGGGTDQLLITKNLTTTNTKYIERAAALAIGDNIFAAYGAGQAFQNWTSKTLTGTGMSLNDFDLVTGIWTCPATGKYEINGFINYVLNTASQTAVTSNNTNTNGFGWDHDNAAVFFTLGFVDFNGSVVLGYCRQPINVDTSGQLFISSFCHQKIFTAGDRVLLVPVNNTGLALYGQAGSSVTIRILKVN